MEEKTMSQFKRAVWSCGVCVGLLLAATAPVLAHGPKPLGIVVAFHAALESGDREAALELLLPEAMVFEGGRGQTVEEYASHHLASDIRFSQATSREILEQSDQTVGEVAWVTTRSRRTGSVEERAIDSMGVETVVLQHVKAGWRIAHIHWSSATKP